MDQFIIGIILWYVQYNDLIIIIINKKLSIYSLNQLFTDIYCCRIKENIPEQTFLIIIYIMINIPKKPRVLARDYPQKHFSEGMRAKKST